MGNIDKYYPYKQVLSLLVGTRDVQTQFDRAQLARAQSACACAQSACACAQSAYARA
jgi:hypothetical protein